MANIRIKDLSTTASSTASDDFFGVDGATNGTRKLSAYSPTFGGNLTVSGTTASTSTTTGALVVSGGVGVAGAIYAGGISQFADGFTVGTIGNSASIVLSSSVVASNTGIWLKQATPSSTNYAFLSGGSNNYFNATTQGNLRINNGQIASWTSTGFNVEQSTASTSTTTGALVVSGGVGVAGAIYGTTATFTSTAAPALTLTNATAGQNAQATVTNSQSGQYSILRMANSGGTAASYDIGVAGSAAGTNPGGLFIYDSISALQVLKFAPTTGNATFAGAIAIGNTVNTVSPTSPNRTVTIVIGGTTYYLAAKTTND